MYEGEASTMVAVQEEALTLRIGHEVRMTGADSSGPAGYICHREEQRAEEQGGPNERPQGQAGNTCSRSDPCVSWPRAFHHFGASHRPVVLCVIP